jgi:isopenicillin N synthase-like dioxygenase
MGSIDSSKAPSLPILSLTSPTLTTDLYAACRDHGFFYLTDHGISVSMLDQIIDLARRFFLESLDSEKQKIKRETVENGGDGARGYQVLNENVTKGLRDYQEAIDLYREWDGQDENVESKTNNRYEFLKGPNLWPKHPPELKSVYEAYTEQCMEVGTKLIKAMSEALDLEGSETDTMLNATRKSFWVMRLIGYPPLQNGVDEEGVSCGEHSGTNSYPQFFKTLWLNHHVFF